MDLNSLSSNFHWIPAIVLTIFSFLIGFSWQQPFLFGRTWKKENNPDNAPIKINAPLIFGGTAVPGQK
jgi:NADH:ubiquinone oxidoreductase subunit 5 (subunit L)/multisubunit Na+/H+ antiporter MnhA subunit